MTLNATLSGLSVPLGASSVIAAVMGHGDPASVSPKTYGGEALVEAEKELERYRLLQSQANSDYAWWGYASSVTQWECVVNLLKAAEITGPDSLPNVDFPNTDDHCLMDSLALWANFGKQVLSLAEAAK